MWVGSLLPRYPLGGCTFPWSAPPVSARGRRCCSPMMRHTSPPWWSWRLRQSAVPRSSLVRVEGFKQHFAVSSIFSVLMVMVGRCALIQASFLCRVMTVCFLLYFFIHTSAYSVSYSTLAFHCLYNDILLAFFYLKYFSVSTSFSWLLSIVVCHYKF